MAELENPKVPSEVARIGNGGGSGLSRTQKDLLAGTVAGWSQVLVGQPFDRVKVVLQTSSGAPISTLECASSILKSEGPLSFWKGSLSPLIGIGGCVAIQFGVLQSAKRFFSSRKSAGQELSSAELFASGAAAGVANTIVSGPVEHVRIRMQTSNEYKGLGDCLKKLYAQGGLRGVFKGQVSTIWRDGVGYGSYFAAYEALVQNHLKSSPGLTRSDISPVWAVTYGAAAGYALWASVYPVDVIKSKIQTDSLDPSKAKYKGMIDCAVKTWRQGGVKGFTNGLTPTLIRSPFANGATFLFFELTMRMLD